MRFFSRIFGWKGFRSVILIDIGDGSVGGAIAFSRTNERPVMLYAARVPVAPHPGEASLSALTRTLESVVEKLQREGAPLLLRASGSGRADETLVSFDAPWQSASLRAVDIEQPQPFTFSRRTMEAALRREEKTPPGAVLADESVVGTILNGYETGRPFGKTATRARILILVSHIALQAAQAVTRTLAARYHSRAIRLVAGVSVRVQGIRAAFPLERDALVVDRAGAGISIALMRHGLLTAIDDAQGSAERGAMRVEDISARLGALAGRYPLPRVLFLLARSADDARALSETLGAPPMRALWLSENPPTLLPLAPAHLNALLATPLEPSADLPLALMTVFWAYQTRELYPPSDPPASLARAILPAS